MAGSKDVIKLNESTVNLTNPAELASFATTLKGFIVKNNLFTSIQNKNYVNVEGWQFAGASLGVFPIVRWTKRMETDATEIVYKARVELVRISDGLVVGAGEAICSNKESKRKGADEYVIESMAQTRATGKAFRTFLAWIMKLAGYETTPTEEATSPESERVVTQDELKIEDVKLLVTSKLNAMSASQKVSFLKEHASSITEAKLTDQQYRRLYTVLNREAA